MGGLKGWVRCGRVGGGLGAGGDWEGKAEKREEGRAGPAGPDGKVLPYIDFGQTGTALCEVAHAHPLPPNP